MTRIMFTIERCVNTLGGNRTIIRLSMAKANTKKMIIVLFNLSFSNELINKVKNNIGTIIERYSKRTAIQYGKSLKISMTR